MSEVNEQKYDASYNVGAHADLVLRNIRGAIDIAGWDQPTVSISALKKLGTEWGAKESFDDTEVRMEQDGNQVRVSTERRGGGGLLSWMGIGRTAPVVEYKIRVPATSDVSIRTVEGHISVSDIIGSVYARTVSGEIRLDRLSGQIITSCVEANVLGQRIGGTLAVKTVSGNVSALQSQLSSFWSKAVSGSIDLETSLDPAGRYEAHTVDGSFSLLVPPDSKATIDMSSVSGRAFCDLPCQVIEQSRRNWRGTANGGGASVSFHSVSGDLSLRPTANLSSIRLAPAPAASASPSSAGWPEMSILKAVEGGQMSVEDAIAKLAELDKSS